MGNGHLVSWRNGYFQQQVLFGRCFDNTFLLIVMRRHGLEGNRMPFLKETTLGKQLRLKL